MMQQLLDGLALVVTSGLLSPLVGAALGGAAGLPLACLSGRYSLWLGVVIGGSVGLACALVAVADPDHRLAGVGPILGPVLGLYAWGGLLTWLHTVGPGISPQGTSDWAYLVAGALFCGAVGFLAGRSCERVARTLVDYFAR